MDGYLLSPRAAGQLGDLFAQLPGGPDAAGEPTAGRQTTLVRVTGAAVSGWYPGVAVTYVLDGTKIDHPCPVEVKAAAGAAALVTGTEYECRRTGPSPAGVPRYVAAGPGGTAAGTWLMNTTGYANENGGSSVRIFTDDTVLTLTDNSRNWVILGVVSVYLDVATFASFQNWWVEAAVSGTEVTGSITMPICGLTVASSNPTKARGVGTFMGRVASGFTSPRVVKCQVRVKNDLGSTTPHAVYYVSKFAAIPADNLTVSGGGLGSYVGP